MTGIWRKTDDFINNVINGAQWRPVPLTNALTNQTFTGYNWANRSSTERELLHPQHRRVPVHRAPTAA